MRPARLKARARLRQELDVERGARTLAAVELRQQFARRGALQHHSRQASVPVTVRGQRRQRRLVDHGHWLLGSVCQIWESWRSRACLRGDARFCRLVRAQRLIDHEQRERASLFGEPGLVTQVAVAALGLGARKARIVGHEAAHQHDLALHVLVRVVVGGQRFLDDAVAHAHDLAFELRARRRETERRRSRRPRALCRRA